MHGATPRAFVALSGPELLCCTVSVAKARKTHQGFRDPLDADALGKSPATPASPVSDGPEVTVHAPPNRPATFSPAAPSGGAALPFDVDVAREVGTPTLIAGPWIAIEVWTQNRIYGVGAAMTCVFVRDRGTGENAPDHPTLGARLAGGQRRNDAGLIVEVSHPLPEPNFTAVFVTGMGARLRVSETSKVTRVVFHQRTVALGPEGGLPTWDEITDPGLTGG